MRRSGKRTLRENGFKRHRISPRLSLPEFHSFKKRCRNLGTKPHARTRYLILRDCEPGPTKPALAIGASAVGILGGRPRSAA